MEKNRKLILKNKIIVLIPFLLLIYILILMLSTSFFSRKDKFFRYKNQKIVFMDQKPKDWVLINQISKGCKWPIIISEDWAFYEHFGVDFRQLFEVFKGLLATGKLERGASTITQQVIKNLFLYNEKTIFRKINEIILAVIYEVLFTKDQILEKYLNLIELGKDIYGIKNASKFYFNKSPSDIQLREGAFLAMLLPSPKKYSVSYRKKELTPYALEKINTTLDKLVVAKVITADERDNAKDQRFSWEKIEPGILDQFLDFFK